MFFFSSKIKLGDSREEEPFNLSFLCLFSWDAKLKVTWYAVANHGQDVGGQSLCLWWKTHCHIFLLNWNNNDLNILSTVSRSVRNLTHNAQYCTVWPYWCEGETTKVQLKLNQTLQTYISSSSDLYPEKRHSDFLLIDIQLNVWK